MTRTIRAFLLFEAVTFLAAALAHLAVGRVALVGGASRGTGLMTDTPHARST